MNILIATCYTLPGISGGWTTPVDLLARDHALTYLVARGQPGRYELEGIRVVCPLIRLPRIERGRILPRIASAVNTRSFTTRLRMLAKQGDFDLLLCLDTLAAHCAQQAGLRYILRIHDTPPVNDFYSRVVANAIAITSVDPTVRGATYLPHGVDFDRFTFREHASARSAVLVATLNSVTDPLLFVKGIERSCLPGTVYGDGYMRSTVKRACDQTRGKVVYAGPVRRLELNERYGHHQVGIACLNRDHNPYVMKITEYQACGIYPVVQPKTHVATEAPQLCAVFEDADGLARAVDSVVERWSSLRESREQARAWADERYGIDKPRAIFSELLERLRRDDLLGLYR